MISERFNQVAGYAGELAVTPNYLSEVTKKLTGFSAGHLIRRRIILEVKRLGRYSDHCMKEIAYNLGFCDSAHHDGWVAATTPFRKPWQILGGETQYPSRDFQWELYHMSDDFSEAENLVAKYPDTLKSLQDLFYAEAKKNNVLPLDATFGERAAPGIRPSLTTGRTHFEYYEGAVRIPEGSAPVFVGQSWTLTADVTTAADANGVLATMGGYFGGFALLIKDDKPMFLYRGSNQPQWLTTIQSTKKLSVGNHKITVDFNYDGGGLGKGANLILSVDGKQVAKGRVERTVMIRFSLDETWDVGEDTGTPVEFNIYDVPFKFNGRLNKLTVDLKGNTGK